MRTKETKSSLIVKSNELINARLSGFNLSQHRLFDILISQLDKNQGNFHKQRVYFKDFVDKTGTAHKGEYARAREITKSLMKKVVEVFEDGQLRQRNIFYSADYPEGQPYVEIVFHPDLRPYLLELSRNFTSYDLKNTLAVKSVYSVRMYQILRQYAYRGKATFEVDDLKELLDASNYNLYADFKRNCLLIAEKELNKKCDLTFTFEELKQGRKVARIHFLIKANSEKAHPFLSAESNDNNQNLINELTEMGLSLKQAHDYVNSHDHQDIRNKIQYTRTLLDSGKVKKPGAYLKKILDDGVVLEAPVVQKKQFQKEEKKNEINEQKEKRRENDRLIESLITEFEDFRSIERQKALSKFTAQDWQEFDEWARMLPTGGGLFRDGKLNKQAEKFDFYSDVFASSRLPNYQKHFMAWAYQVHGLTLCQRKDDDKKFDVIARQEGLFSKY